MSQRRRKSRGGDSSESRPGSARALPLTPEIERDIESWAMEAAEQYGLELFDVEVGVAKRWIIRAYLDKPQAYGPGEGITIDECASVSRYLEAYLDADERIPEAYLLEVSSPGIERPLKKERHVAQVIGREVELNVREPVDNEHKVIGELVSFENGILEVRRASDEHVVEVSWENVAKAKLKYDFSGVKGR